MEGMVPKTPKLARNINAIADTSPKKNSRQKMRTDRFILEKFIVQKFEGYKKTKFM
jgi:hypothetical protein